MSLIYLVSLCSMFLVVGFGSKAHSHMIYPDPRIGANSSSIPVLNTNGKTYVVQFFFKANWFRANQFCRYNGMQLAAITTQGDQAKLESEITELGLQNERFWISGNDLLDEGNFSWMSNGRPIVFARWAADQPDNLNGEEDCVELMRFQWNDNMCSRHYYFVCEQ